MMTVFIAAYDSENVNFQVHHSLNMITLSICPQLNREIFKELRV